MRGLAPLPAADGLYLQQEGMTDTYTKWNWEHPSLIGALGMLPGDGVDPLIMRATVRKVMTDWQWDRCWGWDFPMMAMAAARNGKPRLAVEALLHGSKKNQFNVTGLSSGGPFPYFPSNGGLLYAAAMMSAGWDGTARPQCARVSRRRQLDRAMGRVEASAVGAAGDIIYRPSKRLSCKTGSNT